MFFQETLQSMWWLLSVLAVCSADIVEWGGIDTQVPATQTGYAGVSMDNVATIFPAAIFHGALAIDGGDLVLDKFSDVVVGGLNVTLREVIRGQRTLFAFMCNKSCVTGQHVSHDCQCVCDEAGFIVGSSGVCILDCYGHGTESAGLCVCVGSYTEASQCRVISCVGGTYLLDGACVTPPIPPPLAVWACVNPETAPGCRERGNWLAGMATSTATVCAPIFRWPLVFLATCTGGGCCAAPDSWWAVDCAATTSLYCSPFVRSTFDMYCNI